MQKILLLLLLMISKRSLITEESSVASIDLTSLKNKKLFLTSKLTRIRGLIQEPITSKIAERLDLVVKRSKRLMMSLHPRAQDLVEIITTDSLMLQILLVPIALSNAISKLLDNSKIEDQIGLKTKDLINVKATLSMDARLMVAMDLLLEDVVVMETFLLLQDSPSSITSLR